MNESFLVIPQNNNNSNNYPSQTAQLNYQKLQSKTSILSSTNNVNVTRIDSQAEINTSQGRISIRKKRNDNLKDLSPMPASRQMLMVKIGKNGGGTVDQRIRNLAGINMNGSQDSIESPILSKKKR